MNNFLYVTVLILVVVWGTAFFIYDAGGYIHLLLIIAVFPLLLRVIRGKDFISKKTDKKTLKDTANKK